MVSDGKFKKTSVLYVKNHQNSILNKQKIIKKIPFLVKMTSFRPNHKISSGKLELKSILKFLEKIKFKENHKDCDFEKSSFSTHSLSS
jgi:hypothetical protein